MYLPLNIWLVQNSLTGILPAFLWTHYSLNPSELTSSYCFLVFSPYRKVDHLYLFFHNTNLIKTHVCLNHFQGSSQRKAMNKAARQKLWQRPYYYRGRNPSSMLDLPILQLQKSRIFKFEISQLLLPPANAQIEIGAHLVAQRSRKLLASKDPPSSAFQNAGITNISHGTWSLWFAVLRTLQARRGGSYW